MLIEALIAVPDWDQRACGHRNAHLFFGPEKETKAEREARETLAGAVCDTCPIQAACLAYALTAGEKHGVWGGMSEEDRLMHRLTRAAGASVPARCYNGHELTQENTRWDGQRIQCRICSRATDRRRGAGKKEGKEAA